MAEMKASTVELLEISKPEQKTEEQFDWKRHLRTHRWALEDYLDPRPVLDILHKEEIISSLQRETLTEVNGGSLRMMVNSLVDLLLKKEVAAFDAFCRACKETGQKHVSGLLNNTHGDESKLLTPTHRKKISLLLDILPTLHPKELRELLGFLEVNKVLQTYERQEIQNEENQQISCVLLVSCLLRKPDWCFQELIRVIEVIGLHQIARQLHPMIKGSEDIEPSSPCKKQDSLIPSSSENHVYEAIPQDKIQDEQPVDLITRIKSIVCCSLFRSDPRVKLELCSRDRLKTVFPWDIVSLPNETLVIRDLNLTYIQQIDATGYVLNIFEINEPISCVASCSNFLYIASCSGNIYKFDTDSHPARILKTLKPEGIGLICSMVVPETNSIIICDQIKNEIIEYNETTGKSRIRISKLQGLKYISVMESLQDRLYIVSLWANEHCVNIYSAKWHLLHSVGEEGAEDSLFSYPYATIMSSSQTFLVSDSHNHRVSEFDLEGNFKRHVLDEKHGILYPKGITLIENQLWLISRDSKTDLDMVKMYKITR